MNYFIAEQNEKQELFVLFHGTGGNEFSLLFLTGELEPNAGVISFIGSIGTGQERRFFKPLIDQQLDLNNFQLQVDDFLKTWDSIQLTDKKITFIGYSNGANFIQGILTKRPDIAHKVMLLHPHNFNLEFPQISSAAKIVVTTGANDSYSTAGESMKLQKQLAESFSTDVGLILTDGEHGIAGEEVKKIQEWYTSN